MYTIKIYVRMCKLTYGYLILRGISLLYENAHFYENHHLQIAVNVKSL